MVAEYTRQTDGSMGVAALPRLAPCGGGKAAACVVGHHSTRSRKTGPGYGLVVVRCAAHRRCFTIYPPGYAPYLRASVQVEAEAAVLDAASGEAWRGALARRTGRHWRTQNRRIAWYIGLLGLDGNRSELVAQALGVPLHQHKAAVLACSKGREIDRWTSWYWGFERRGCAVVSVLEAAAAAARRRRCSPVWRLYQAGYITGVWGRAWRIRKQRGASGEAWLNPVFRI